MESANIKTPLGMVKIEGDMLGLSSITILDSNQEPDAIFPKILEDAIHQLQEYFKGKRRAFTINLNPKGTDFQKKVWEALRHIPYGKTMSYLELAKTLGDIKAIRAVAAANGKNPLWIVIPCHRVIGSDGSLTGYAGGLHRKKWLLNHENPVKQQSLFD
ncbi:methylated-DNA--[protein]-cysteine S-methyltransferase [uncultured Kriegella sp.]|uniref:methylated-DNA--[protein]-cysteine S-methyltransferase n=1 Tax=uncultured Kriegella sp. TaxID=1798910 RepID=UPI0030D8FB85|tara:strand:- start:3448 stop:3924 length:477 start_codon:yes stop_codon:yes gene_type:complete